jgi:hypothetical protein
MSSWLQQFQSHNIDVLRIQCKLLTKAVLDFKYLFYVSEVRKTWIVHHYHSGAADFETVTDAKTGRPLAKPFVKKFISLPPIELVLEEYEENVSAECLLVARRNEVRSSFSYNCPACQGFRDGI